MTNRRLSLTTLCCALGLASSLSLSACESDSKDAKDKDKTEDKANGNADAADPNDDAKVDAKAEVEANGKVEAEVEVEDEGGLDNLCKQYKSCDACIAGQQAEGKTEGEAETQCGLAVTGCWATWDKPIKCGDKTYDDKPED